jgi:hypothetical protein
MRAATTDVMFNTRRRERRYLRWFAVLVATLLAAVVTLEWTNRRNERASELIFDLQTNGGTVYMPPTMLDNARNVWASGTWAWPSDTTVMLGDDIDSDWVRRHEYLAALNVTRLDVYHDKVDTATLQRILEIHPINTLSTLWRTDTDTLAKLLASEDTLRNVYLNNSDLTDVGFQALPLEQIEMLDVEQTQVTAEGLCELHRCGRLETLSLSGNQFTEPVAEVLASKPSLQGLYLNGPAVTDAVVPHLRRLQKLDFLFLSGTTLTKDGIDALNEGLPGCVISIDQDGVY